MKRLMIGIAAASLLSVLSFTAQADERGARHGFSRMPSHSSAYNRTHRAAPRHYQPSGHNQNSHNRSNRPQKARKIFMGI